MNLSSGTTAAFKLIEKKLLVLLSLDREERWLGATAKNLRHSFGAIEKIAACCIKL
jgi:hypothetical protein